MFDDTKMVVYELYLLDTSQKSKNITSTCLTKESVLQEAEKSRLFIFLILHFNIGDIYLHVGLERLLLEHK